MKPAPSSSTESRDPPDAIASETKKEKMLSERRFTAF
jgi:hypothetical protein